MFTNNETNLVLINYELSKSSNGSISNIVESVTKYRNTKWRPRFKLEFAFHRTTKQQQICIIYKAQDTTLGFPKGGQLVQCLCKKNRKSSQPCSYYHPPFILTRKQYIDRLYQRLISQFEKIVPSNFYSMTQKHALKQVHSFRIEQYLSQRFGDLAIAFIRYLNL